MKTDEHFKLSKTTKRMMALQFAPGEPRNTFRTILKDAENDQRQAKRRKHEPKEAAE